MARTPRRRVVQFDANDARLEEFEAAYEAGNAVVKHEDGFWLVTGMNEQFDANGRRCAFTLRETNAPGPT